MQAVDGPRLAATVPNPGGRYPFGVGVFTSRTGMDCVLAGQALGDKLGLFRNGRFHPYGADVPGVCVDLDRTPKMHDLLHLGDKTLVFGLATPSRTPPASLIYEGRRYEPTLGRGGSFLFVIDASVDINRLREASSPAASNG